MTELNPQEMVTEHREQADDAYHDAVFYLGIAGLNAIGIAGEGGWRVCSIIAGAGFGVYSLAKGVQGYREDRQADRLEAILVERQVREQSPTEQQS